MITKGYVSGARAGKARRCRSPPVAELGPHVPGVRPGGHCAQGCAPRPAPRPGASLDLARTFLEAGRSGRGLGASHRAAPAAFLPRLRQLSTSCFQSGATGNARRAAPGSSTFIRVVFVFRSADLVPNQNPSMILASMHPRHTNRRNHGDVTKKRLGACPRSLIQSSMGL